MALGDRYQLELTVQETRRLVLNVFLLVLGAMVSLKTAPLVWLDYPVFPLICTYLILPFTVFYIFKGTRIITIGRGWWIWALMASSLTIWQLFYYFSRGGIYLEFLELIVITSVYSILAILFPMLWPNENEERSTIRQSRIHLFLISGCLTIASTYFFEPIDASPFNYLAVFGLIALLTSNARSFEVPRLTALLLLIFFMLFEGGFIYFLSALNDLISLVFTSYMSPEKLELYMPSTKLSTFIDNLINHRTVTYETYENISRYLLDADETKLKILGLFGPLLVLLVSRRCLLRFLTLVSVSPIYYFILNRLIEVGSIQLIPIFTAISMITILAVFLQGTRGLQDSLPAQFKRRLVATTFLILSPMYFILSIPLSELGPEKEADTESTSAQETLFRDLSPTKDGFGIDFADLSMAVVYQGSEEVFRRLSTTNTDWRLNRSDMIFLSQYSGALHYYSNNYNTLWGYDPRIIFDLRVKAGFLYKIALNNMGSASHGYTSNIYPGWLDATSPAFDARYTPRLEVWEDMIAYILQETESADFEDQLNMIQKIYRISSRRAEIYQTTFKNGLLMNQGERIEIYMMWIAIRVLRYRHETGHFPEDYHYVLQRFGYGVGDMPSDHVPTPFFRDLKLYKHPGGDAITLKWNRPPYSEYEISGTHRDTIFWNEASTDD